MTEPLTNEQIWGVPDEQLPEPDIKDYFDLEDEEDTARPNNGGQDFTGE